MEHLINEIPDRQINERQALAEILAILEKFPNLKDMVRLKISRVYPCDS